MAITPSYAHSDTLKKLTIGSEIFWLKDADLRTVVEAFGTATGYDVDVTFDATGAKLATEKATADYIAEQIKGLEGAMHFMGVVERAEGQTDLEAIAAHYAALEKTPASGDVVIIKDNSKEYIYNGTVWEEIGDQAIYLTKAEAAATYTPKNRTIAGIDLQDNITDAELKTALDLKALSHKDEASGTYKKVTGADNISVGKAGEYTVTGDSVAVPSTYNALDVTAAGSVEVAQDTQAAATYQKTSSATISATAPTESSTANYTPAGNITLPSLTSSVSLTAESVPTVTDAGTAYSITNGSVVKADDTTSKFVKKGVSFEVDEEEECLTLAYVTNTDTNFYGDAVTAAGGVTYTAPVLSGALPTFGTKEVAAKTGASATTVYDGSATFSGTGTVLGASLAYETADANVTQPAFSAEFVPTTKSVTPTVATTVNAQAPSGKVTVASQDTAITINTEDATVTVS